MIDHIVSLLLNPDRPPATQNADSSHIRVVEAIDCRNSNRRFFSRLNRESSLEVIVSEESTITSCKVDGQEIVFSPSLCPEPHETWAIGDRPYLNLANFLWNSHVRGSELILSTNSPLSDNNFRNLISNNNNNSSSSSGNSPHTTLHYKLTRSNELHCTSKLKSIHMQHQVFYFNLQRALPANLIDGHRLAIRCNGSLREIQVQPTRLLCRCNKSLSAPIPSETAQSLVSDTPFELRQRLADPMTDACAVNRADEVIISDAIYSRESTSAHDFIEAQLQFADRSVTFQVRSARPVSPNNASGSTGSSNVSSSTFSGKARQAGAKDGAISDLMQNLVKFEVEEQRSDGCSQQQQQQQVDDSIATSSSPSADLNAVRIKLEPQESGYFGGISSSEPKLQYANNNAKVAAPSCSQRPSVMIRIRVRVTNFGVCVLPYMMTNYTSSYKFSW